MKKFFDSRRELVSSGPGSGGGGGGSSSAGGNFIGRVFTIGRHQVTVDETIAEGESLGVLSLSRSVRHLFWNETQIVYL